MPYTLREEKPRLSVKGGQPLAQRLFAKAVFRLDRHLQRRNGVICYTSDPRCIFRIALNTLEHPVLLENGRCMAAGVEVASLHLWNEQLPLLSKDVTAVAWGLQMSRHLAHSLRLLSDYLASGSHCDGVCAVCADMALGTPEQTEQLLRICGRFGFLSSRSHTASATGAWHRLGENILISMMVIARNVRAFRLSSMRRSRVRVFLTREELDKRFGKNAGALSPQRLAK